MIYYELCPSQGNRCCQRDHWVCAEDCAPERRDPWGFRQRTVHWGKLECLLFPCSGGTLLRLWHPYPCHHGTTEPFMLLEGTPASRTPSVSFEVATVFRTAITTVRDHLILYPVFQTPKRRKKHCNWCQSGGRPLSTIFAIPAVSCLKRQYYSYFWTPLDFEECFLSHCNYKNTI